MAMATIISVKYFGARNSLCLLQLAPIHATLALHWCMSVRIHTLHHSNGHFPGEPGLAGYPLNSLSPFIPEHPIGTGLNFPCQ